MQNLLGKANVKPSRKAMLPALHPKRDLHGGSERRAAVRGAVQYEYCSSPELLHTLLTSSEAPKHELLTITPAPKVPPSSMAKGTNKTWTTVLVLVRTVLVGTTRTAYPLYGTWLYTHRQYSYEYGTGIVHLPVL